MDKMFSNEIDQIAAKLVAVRRDVRHPERSEYNDFAGYYYSNRDDIFEVCRAALNDHGVEWCPSMTIVNQRDNGTQTGSGKPQYRHVVRVQILYIDSDSGQYLTQTWDGESLHNDEKGPQMASTQAVRFALTNHLMLLDDAEVEQYQAATGGANNHEVTRQTSAPADPAQAIVDRLYEVGLDDEQVALFGQWLEGMEGVESLDEISQSRMMSWYERFESYSDAELADKAIDAINDKHAA